MTSRANFWPLWLVAGLVVFPTAFLWFMSPMGLGFAAWPDGAVGHMLEAVFRFGYFIVNPAFVLAWLTLPLWHSAGYIRQFGLVTLLLAACAVTVLVVL